MLIMAKNKKIFKSPFSAATDYFIRVLGINNEILGDAVGYKKGKMIDAIRNGRSEGAEHKRRLIADYFECKYDHFLEIGSQIIDGTFNGVSPLTPRPPQPPAKQKTDIEIQADKTHEQLVGRFVDKETALKINQLLIRLEELENGDGLKSALEWAEYRVHQAELKSGGSQSTGTEGE